MRYTVVWLPAALDELADIWNNAPDRADVSDSANDIDVILAQHPYSLSESREGRARVMLISPLGVSYEVSDSDCLVTVTGVWRTK